MRAAHDKDVERGYAWQFLEQSVVQVVLLLSDLDFPALVSHDLDNLADVVIIVHLLSLLLAVHLWLTYQLYVLEGCRLQTELVLLRLLHLLLICIHEVVFGVCEGGNLKKLVQNEGINHAFSVLAHVLGGSHVLIPADLVLLELLLWRTL